MVEPVHPLTKAIPAVLLALTNVPKSVTTTVGPPTPVEPVAALHSAS
jgi:hypothetical protein